MSYAIAREMCGESSRIELEGDLALSLEEKKIEKKPACDTPYAVIAVNGCADKSEQMVIAERAADLWREGMRIVVVGMYPREDGCVCRKLAKRFNGEYIEDADSEELIAILKGAEICCSSRLHLLIFARIAEIDFEGFGNDPKIAAFCREHGKRA